VVTGHDGVFLLLTEDVAVYVNRFGPQCLRSMAGYGKALNLNFINFKVAKGATYERVLIVPTTGLRNSYVKA
jgi:hypothetical protein